MDPKLRRKRHLQKKIKAQLIGRTITAVRYQTPEEVADRGWSRAAVVLVLDNGDELVPGADNEGNDAGALFTDGLIFISGRRANNENQTVSHAS